MNESWPSVVGGNATDNQQLPTEYHIMSHELRIPEVGESIREVQIGQWLKQEGQWAEKDESLVQLESDKATVDLPAPVAGVVTKIVKHEGEVAAVGEIVGYLEETAQPKADVLTKAPPPAVAGAKEAQPPQAAAHAGRPPAAVMPAAAAALAEHNLQADEIEATGPGGRLLKEDVLRHVEQQSPPVASPGPLSLSAAPPARKPEQPRREPSSTAVALPGVSPVRQEEAVPMSLLRRRIAERLVEAQQSAALLTTFNEVDMTPVIELRQRYRDAFQQKYDVKLGFMSFFVKAAIEALKACPELNAEIRGHDIVYHNYFDLGIAVGSGKGLVVPVLRNAERMSFAEVERAVGDFGARALSGKLKPDELSGGTFTISNGGVFGSMLSTPIINPPQSGILGLHAIQERPVARHGEVVIRPMMYLALTYDHRIVDGREAVGFLRRVKEVIEEPSRILLEI
jgi:2-oxoglutarate dehydrogenase E2 component (dihydrolipoamide succinyltransferase)